MGWSSFGVLDPRPLASAGKVDLRFYVTSQETRCVGWDRRSGRGTAPYPPLRILHALSASEGSEWLGVAWFVGTFLRTYRNPYP